MKTYFFQSKCGWFVFAVVIEALMLYEAAAWANGRGCNNIADIFFNPFLWAVLVLIVGGVFVQYLDKKETERYKPNHCTACASARVMVISDGVSRCEDCGYEWGDGLKRRQEQQQMEILTQTPLEKRIESALTDLADASMHLEQAKLACQQWEAIPAIVHAAEIEGRRDYYTERDSIEKDILQSVLQAIRSGRLAVNKLRLSHPEAVYPLDETLQELEAQPIEERAKRNLPYVLTLIQYAQEKIAKLHTAIEGFSDLNDG